MLLGAATPALYAQTIYFGIGGAVDYNSYTRIDNFGIVDYKGAMGYRGGFAFRYKLNSKVSFKSNLNYASKRYREVIDFTLVPIDPNDPAYDQDKIESIYITRFIEVPLDVMLKLNKKDKFDIVSTFGVVNSFQIGSKYINSLVTSESKVYGNYLLGLKTGLGFLFRLDNVGIYIESQVGLYLNQVHTRFPERNPIHFGLEFQVLKINRLNKS